VNGVKVAVKHTHARTPRCRTLTIDGGPKRSPRTCQLNKKTKRAFRGGGEAARFLTDWIFGTVSETIMGNITTRLPPRRVVRHRIYAIETGRRRTGVLFVRRTGRNKRELYTRLTGRGGGRGWDGMGVGTIVYATTGGRYTIVVRRTFTGRPTLFRNITELFTTRENPYIPWSFYKPVFYRNSPSTGRWFSNIRAEKKTPLVDTEIVGYLN